MKQTAVEWLYEELLAQFHLQIDSFIAHELKGKLNQAKEMEKENLKSLKDFDTWKEWKNKSE